MKHTMHVTAMLTLLAAPVAAGGGAAELSLDRAAVAELLAAALPEPLALALPGFGETSLRLGRPERVDFRDGGVEAVLPLEIGEGQWSTPLALRLVPEVEPLSGTIRLRVESLRPERRMPVALDLAGWIGAFDLPRRLDWALEAIAESPLSVTCFLQGAEVREERLVLELGLVLRPAS